MKYWIVSSKHSRDQATESWDSKWTANNFLRHGKYYPAKRKEAPSEGDRCILKVFGAQDFIGDFSIASAAQTDKDGDTYYELEDVNEWEFVVDEHSLPSRYREVLSRSPITEIPEQMYYELLGIRNFMQNLRLNYRDRLRLNVTERVVESLLDAKNALRSKGLDIIDRQLELTPGNIIDLLCQDERGNLVVVELKKGGANKTIGQLARYISDVREQRASSTQRVKGLILSTHIDEQLVKAADAIHFEVVLCEIRFV